jgi:hypothetical protein
MLFAKRTVPVALPEGDMPKAVEMYVMISSGKY